jgi:hypothetical protein
MIRWVLLAGLGLRLAVAAVVYFGGILEPSGHTDYALRKQLHDASGKTGIIWHAMPVAEAYEAIPHQRTPFRPEQAKASRDEADYLGALLTLTDAAVAERVATQAKLGSGEPPAPGKSNYEAILSGILALDTPGHLVAVEALVYQAVAEQSRYLEDWRVSARRDYFDPDDPLVESSHKKLVGAYDRLLKLYGKEGRHNKRAFHDHLSALDFI